MLLAPLNIIAVTALALVSSVAAAPVDGSSQSRGPSLGKRIGGDELMVEGSDFNMCYASYSKARGVVLERRCSEKRDAAPEPEPEPEPFHNSYQMCYIAYIPARSPSDEEIAKRCA